MEDVIEFLVGERLVSPHDGWDSAVRTSRADFDERQLRAAVRRLPDIARDLHAAIGIIATPAVAAQDVADRLVAAGISSILNFAPAIISVPAEASLRKVDLALELQILSFYQQQRSGGPHLPEPEPSGPTPVSS